jgi:hypothetical protein
MLNRLSPENRNFFIQYVQPEIGMAREAAGQIGRTQVLQGVTTAGGQE